MTFQQQSAAEASARAMYQQEPYAPLEQFVSV
jgi:hypothetical protein